MVLSAFLDRVGIPKDRSNQTFRMLWKKFENRELEDPQVCRELKKRFKCKLMTVTLGCSADYDYQVSKLP